MGAWFPSAEGAILGVVSLIQMHCDSKFFENGYRKYTSWPEKVALGLNHHIDATIQDKQQQQQQQQQRPFNGLLSGTTRVGRYQMKHSPTHTHPDHRASFITFLHLQRSMASSLFNLCA